MLVVVEGMDRTGKSSLVEELRRREGGEVVHWDRPTRPTAIAEYVEPLLGYRPGEGRHVWCDRHYLGETVWPGVFGRESIMTAADRTCVELFLAHAGALTVLAWRDPDELEAACEAEGEPSAGRAAETQLEFYRQTRASLLPWWLWHHGDNLRGPLRRAEELEAVAAERADRGAPLLGSIVRSQWEPSPRRGCPT